MNGVSYTAEELENILRATNAAVEAGNAVYERSVVATREYTKSLMDQYQSKTANLDLVEQYKSRLAELVDANGRVTGSEQEVSTILSVLNENLGTNFKLNGDRITQNGEVYNSYDELNKAIEENVKVLKRQAQQEIITENYKEAMRFQKDYAKNLKDIGDQATKAWDEAKTIGAATGYTGEAYEQAKQKAQGLTDQLMDLRSKHEEYSATIENYEEDLAKTYEEGTEIIINAETGKMETLTAAEQQIRDTLGLTQEQMVEMAKNSTAEWKARYDQLNEDQKATMLAMSSTVETLSPEIIAEWGNLADRSEEEFSNQINWVTSDVKGTILASLAKTKELTPALAKEWESLASTSQGEFAAALQQVSPTTRKEILKSISITQENIEKNKLTWQDFAKQCPQEYEAALNELDPATAEAIKTVVGTLENDTTVKEASKELGTDVTGGYDETANNPTTWAGINNATIQNLNKWIGGLDVSKDARTKGETNIANLSAGIDGRLGWVQSSIDRVKGTISSVTNGTDPWGKGANFLQGIIDGINNKFPKLTSLVSTVASKVGKIFSGKWVEHSPSRLARQQGAFYMEGLALGFEAEENGLYKTAGMIADGVTVTMQDTLSGQTLGMASALQDSIQVNSTATISGTVQNNMKELIAEAVTNANVNVNIEAKTEEGVIVRKATDGINSYIRQTGEMPFPVLI